MKKFSILTACLALCGVLFGGCRRNVGTETTKMTTVPTTQATTATTEATVPTVVPTLPVETGGESGPMDSMTDGSEAARSPRRPDYRPMPHG